MKVCRFIFSLSFVILVADFSLGAMEPKQATAKRDGGNLPGYQAKKLKLKKGNQEVKEEKLDDAQSDLKVIDIDSPDENGNTSLHRAAMAGNLEEVKELIQKGADIFSKNNDRNIPLYVACGEDVKKLLNANHDLSTHVFSGNLAKVKEALNAGANPNLICPCSGESRSILYVAISYKHLEIARELIARGAFVNAQTLSHPRSVFKAKNLLPSSFGNTPLHEAVISGQDNIAKLLLDHKANPKLINDKNKTPLGIAIERSKYGLPCMDMPKEYSYDGLISLINETKDEDGNTPLHRAAMAGNLEEVKELIHHGAKIDSKNNEGNIPLYVARGKEVREFLHVNQTLLAHAKHCFVKKELDAGASPNVNSSEGNALYLAVSGENTTTVNFLLKHGASISPNSGPYSPLAKAKEMKNEDIIKLFLSYTAIREVMRNLAE